MKTQNQFNAASIEDITTKGKIAYSINEVSVLIGVSPNHLRNENKRGLLRFVKSGNRTLILDTDLRSYLEQNVVTMA